LRGARLILEASGKQIIEIGAIGQATSIKIATNMITAASVQALAEALALTQALGVPVEKFVEAMEANASHSATLAMKLPKITQRDFEPHFSVKHMLKDMQIANQLGLSHNLDLGVTAAARDRLLEQMQWGRGDEDYSAVARKYFSEIDPANHAEPQAIAQDLQATADPTPPAPGMMSVSEEPKLHQETPIVAAVEPTAASSSGGKAKEEVQPRRGFLRQLVQRVRQLRKHSTAVSPKEG